MCQRGLHPLSGANLYVKPRSGERNCRACMRKYNKQYSQSPRMRAWYQRHRREQTTAAYNWEHVDELITLLRKDWEDEQRTG